MPLAWHHGGRVPFGIILNMAVSQIRASAVEGDEICVTFLKEKNITNLKVHLKSLHKKANLFFFFKRFSYYANFQVHNFI